MADELTADEIQELRGDLTRLKAELEELLEASEKRMDQEDPLELIGGSTMKVVWAVLAALFLAFLRSWRAPSPPTRACSGCSGCQTMPGKQGW